MMTVETQMAMRKIRWSWSQHPCSSQFTFISLAVHRRGRSRSSPTGGGSGARREKGEMGTARPAARVELKRAGAGTEPRAGGVSAACMPPRRRQLGAITRWPPRNDCS
jgi:hypothetical protein